MNTHINGISKKGKVLIYWLYAPYHLIPFSPIAWIFLSSLKADPMKIQVLVYQ